MLHCKEMKIILAQGNPGAQYAATRHNIGWMILDAYTAASSAEFKPEKKFAALVAMVMIDEEKVLLVKPTTFYNETGRSAQALIDFYKLDPARDLLVIHDDLSLPLGTIRIRDKGSDAGNNGIKSISSHLGPEYQRIRVGIGDEKRERQPDADFVLSRMPADTITFTKEKIAPVVIEAIAQFCRGTLPITSQQVE